MTVELVGCKKANVPIVAWIPVFVVAWRDGLKEGRRKVVTINKSSRETESDR